MNYISVDSKKYNKAKKKKKRRERREKKEIKVIKFVMNKVRVFICWKYGHLCIKC